MSNGDEFYVYICPRCMTPDDHPGLCDRCHVERVACQPGPEGDPLRRPLMDADGRLITQAPGWWLRRVVGDLVLRHTRR